MEEGKHQQQRVLSVAGVFPVAWFPNWSYKHKQAIGRSVSLQPHTEDRFLTFTTATSFLTMLAVDKKEPRVQSQRNHLWLIVFYI